MLTDFPPYSVNKSGNTDDIPIPRQLKVRSDDHVLNTVLQFSKSNMLDSNVGLIEELKQALMPQYGIPSISHDQLLRIIVEKYDKILSDKRYETYQTITSIILDLLKFTPAHNTGVGIECNNGMIYGPFITHEILIKRLLIEITLTRVDWLDYSQI